MRICKTPRNDRHVVSTLKLRYDDISVSLPLIRVSIPVAIALLLINCVRYQPHPLDPPHSEQQFRTRSLSDPGLAAFLKRPDWPPAKLQLRDLYAVALYFSPDLDIARAHLRTTQAAIVTANTRPNPTVSIGSGWTNAPESPIVFHFDSTFIVETGGKRAVRTLEAGKLAEAARVDVDATAWHVLSRVRSAWIDYAMALRSVDVLNNEIRARNETIDILEKRLSVGEGARPEVETARALLIAVQMEARATATSVSEAEATLATAIGLPALPPVDTATLPETLADLPLGDVQKAGLLHRADVRRSLLEYAAEEAALQLEIAKQQPDIQLNPGYAFDEGHHKISFGPGFEIPVFNRNKGPIAEAEARRAEAETRFNALQAQAIGEMESALAAYKGTRTELNEADRTFIALETTRTQAMQRAVAAGEEDRLSLSGVRIESAVAARARLEAERRLEAALGALDDAVQQPLEPGPPLPDPETKQ
jgi:cobalt-zinc-cadmium efflux system outer membrane protein